MAEKVKLSKDGSSIDFVQSDSIPTSVKKFRQSPEIEGFYRFIFENDLQKEAYDILEVIIAQRKAKKAAEKKEAKLEAKAIAAASQAAPVVEKKKSSEPVKSTGTNAAISAGKNQKSAAPMSAAQKNQMAKKIIEDAKSSAGKKQDKHSAAAHKKPSHKK